MSSPISETGRGNGPTQPILIEWSPSIENWAELELGSAHILNGDYSKVLRRVEKVQELRRIAAKIAFVETQVTPGYLDLLRLPQLESPSFWVSEVLPAIKNELERRTRPVKTWGPNSPIARIKAENRVEDVAERLTNLRKAGPGLKGLCPFHKERTPSFVVWPDSQRWRCFGACADGGDVVDLIRKQSERGHLK